jgi:uncharacterized protein
MAVNRNAEEILALLDRHRAELRKLGAVKLGLFGSYVHNQQTTASDIDVLVLLEHNTFDSYMDVKLFLEDLFGHEVDLVIEDAIKPRLRDRILNEAVYVQGL